MGSDKWAARHVLLFGFLDATHICPLLQTWNLAPGFGMLHTLSQTIGILLFEAAEEVITLAGSTGTRNEPLTMS